MSDYNRSGASRMAEGLPQYPTDNAIARAGDRWYMYMHKPALNAIQETGDWPWYHSLMMGAGEMAPTGGDTGREQHRDNWWNEQKELSEKLYKSRQP